MAWQTPGTPVPDIEEEPEPELTGEQIEEHEPDVSEEQLFGNFTHNYSFVIVPVVGGVA